jgi:hypothetical protein
MRGERLRHTLVILIAGCSLGVGFALAADSGAERDAPEVGADSVREPGADGPAAPEPRKARQRKNLPPDEWWAHAREVLLEGLELSEEQTRQIDAIIQSQIDALARALEFQSELRVARQQDDKERGASLRAKLNANRVQIKRPDQRIDEIRALLREEQRPSFDMNRARLLAEAQQPRKNRRKQKPAAGAAPAPPE